MITLTVKAAVVMTATMFLPNGVEMKQAWQTVETTTLDHCLFMNGMFAQGGKAAVMTVRCEPKK